MKKFIEKNLTRASSGEQIKSAIACTFRNHAAAVKSAATIHYVDANGVDKTFFALNSALDQLFIDADHLDDEVIASCLIAAGYRSGRDLTAFENAVKTAESSAAPLKKRDAELRKAAASCGDDVAKHSAIMAEISKGTPALAAARDAAEKARAALTAELYKDANRFIAGFEKRSKMLTEVSEWLYNNAADRFAAVAEAADKAVREHAADFAGRMLAMCDHIAGDDVFPLNQKGRRCACSSNVEDAIVKAIKKPFNGGVGYKHIATGGTRYCDVPLKSGKEVTITKVTD